MPYFVNPVTGELVLIATFGSILEQDSLPPSLKNISAETEEDVMLGQPLYLKENGRLALACGDNAMRSRVCGIAIEPALAGGACSYTNFGSITTSNWTHITGSELLLPSQSYYLDVINAGRLTLVPPESGYLLLIGRAITSLQVALNINQSILL